MRIAILGTRGIPPKYGGFETLADELGRGLSERGHKVVVYGRSGYSQPKRAWINENLLARRVPAIKFKGTESLSAGIFSALHSILKARPEVVLVCNPSNIWTLKILNLFGIPGILHVAGLEPHRVKWKGLGAKVLTAAVRTAVSSKVPLLTDSDAVADWYIKKFNREVHIIKYGAKKPEPDESVLREFGLKNRGYDLIVARWDEDNQVAEAVEAHRNSGVKTPLIIVGQDHNNKNYAEKIREAIEIHPNAKAIGSVWNLDKLGALYAGARCYIHGHSAGGTNPALLIGSVSGAEVLAHQNPFNTEVVGKNGWLWKDPADLSRILENHEWDKSPKSSKLTKDISIRYVWKNIVVEYEALLEKIMSRNI